MNKNLRWKILTILAVFIVFFALGVYPILGGTVQAAGAGLAAWPNTSSSASTCRAACTSFSRSIATTRCGSPPRPVERADARGAAGRPASPPSAITVTSPTTFRVEGRAAGQGPGVPPHRRRADHDATTNAARGRRRRARVRDAPEHRQRDSTSRRWCRRSTRSTAASTSSASSEPNIARHGANDDQILVQLPGVSEVARAKDIIRATALLELKLVEAGPAPTREALLQPHNGQSSRPTWKS